MGYIEYNPGGSNFGMAFGQGATEWARFLSTGNLGIGKTNPSTILDVNGTITCIDINSTSDIKLKTNIKPILSPISKLLQLNGVSFNWIETNKPSIGVIAQEVENVLPELVNGNNPKTVNYNGLIGVLIEAIKEQQDQINTLRDEIDKITKE